MRLWSVHPKYLDPQGLVALWREALLAQKVLMNETKGYKNHPQLGRFRKTKNPRSATATCLNFIVDEAVERGYNFDKSKIKGRKSQKRMEVSKGQLEFELSHLKKKLWKRNRAFHKNVSNVVAPETHPMFYSVVGYIENWERT
ncbi:pyrimidine dimer DNA glycosylase/endonuclease V [Oligoflexia bacterium]|nr:pyrimidine dimer DNA glycosylase/endonuclease V [Oligoflexia bacterium]